MTIIKRHNNGKYYDITHSCYITLSEIRDDILSGAFVKILTVGEKDITSDVLTRILHDKLSTKPKNELVSLIRN